MGIFRSLFLAFLGFCAVCVVVHSQAEEECELLKTSLAYLQEKAPRDLTGVLPVVVERVNKELEGVVDVKVEWTGGDLHGRVGEHIIQCKVTRLLSAISVENLKADAKVTVDELGRQTIVQCFQLPFTIEDSNECQLPEGHFMRHKCQPPAMCVNTVGSYECVCPRIGQNKSLSVPADEAYWSEVVTGREPWELSFNVTTESSCPSSATTKSCCADFAHTKEGKSCRSAFRCPVDSCGHKKHNDCASNAKCMRTESPRQKPNYYCQCPEGLMGNGHVCRSGVDATPKPMVKFDGVTPTDETLKNNYYCGCTKPEVDACEGFPPCDGNHEICVVTTDNEPTCGCKPGYVNNDDGYGCVDETPPILRLRRDPHGDHTLRLKQGDIYKEYAVDIIDENAEDYLRELRITYSEPLPPGCLSHIGEFHVNYTVATPWTTPPYVRVTRRVIIEDVDECTLDAEKLQGSCPELIPQCDISAGAVCQNTIGSYTCSCPEHTRGDGFKTTASFSEGNMPAGFEGGNSCTDSSVPLIEVLGPNPKVYKVCKCGGLTGIGGQSDASSIDELCQTQRRLYKNSIKEMIVATNGGTLCSTHSQPSPTPQDCVRATDQTYRGIIDITSRVQVGNPVETLPLHFEVPYDVVDDAGNAARSWREVIIEEVDLGNFEAKIREEVTAAKEKEIKVAVDDALRRERRNRPERSCPEVQTGRRTVVQQQRTCECPDVTASDCDKYCQKDCPTLVTMLTSLLTQMQLFESASFGVIMFVAFILVIRFISSVLRSIFLILGIGGGGGGQRDDDEDQFVDARSTYGNRRDIVPQTPRVDTVRQAPFSDPPLATGRPVDGGIFSPPENRIRRANDASSPYLSRSNNGSEVPTPYTNGAFYSSTSTGGGYDDSIYQD